MAKTTVLTNNGEDWAVQRLAGIGDMATVSGQFIGWGTSGGTAAKGDTSLFTEAAEPRVQGTVTVHETGAAAYYQVEGTLVSLSSQTITNAGSFTASDGGALLIHMSWDGIALNEGDQITITFRIDPA